MDLIPKSFRLFSHCVISYDPDPHTLGRLKQYYVYTFVRLALYAGAASETGNARIGLYAQGVHSFQHVPNSLKFLD